MDAGHGKVADETGSFPLFHHQSLPQTDVYPLGNRGTSCRTTKPVLCCVVCGDSSSGKHYGVLACNGCSGFFKRSVRRKLIYRCQAASGDCLVDKAHRNQCQACRLKKCLQCGMNKDAVQNERQPRNSATVRPDYSLSSTSRTYIKGSSTTVLDSTVRDITVGVFSPFFTLPSKIFPTTHFGIPKFQHLHDLKDEAASTSISLNKIVPDDGATQFQSLSMMSRIDIKPESMFDPTEETIYETSARILLLTIRWARNLPSYSSLCFEDQILLLEETWSELFLLSAIQWGIPLNTNPLFAAVETALPKLTSIQRQYLCMLQRASTRFKILTTDLTEFACIKAIILFKSDAGRLKDTYQVEMLQDHAQLMLAHHIKTQHIDYIFRFGRLLLILPTLRQIPPVNVEAIFFSNILGSTPMEKFLSDMFNS